MFKALKSITIKTIMAANIVAILLMVVIGYSGHIDPREHALASTVGLGFPIILAINIAFFIFWSIFKKRYVVISILGFIVCWGPVWRYCPLNIPSDPPKNAIKVISYNVWMFNPWDLSEGETNPIVDYLVNSGADIICLQESGYDVHGREKIDSAFADVYQYRDTVQKNGPTGDVLSLYSKFPILSREQIKYKSKGNLSAAYVLRIHGKRVLLVNNHFETVGMSVDDKANFHSIVHGDMDKDSTEHESKSIIRKLARGNVKRASQADAVARVIARYRREGMSAIVCGDFNDSPLSYTHRTVARGLTDCYVASGLGPGWSYHKSGIRVRIDNILCSPEWEPCGAKVDNSIDRSDHYPIVGWLRER